MFYDNFIRLCAKEGKFPSAVAEEMGFHRSVVTRWSKGGNVRHATLERVALHFGITVEELLSDNEGRISSIQGDGANKKESPASNADRADELDLKALDIIHQFPPEKKAAAVAMLQVLLNN